MSLPYIPLYVDDYEAATAHLTIEEDGAYNRLLRLCWRTPGCSVPDDPKWIMRKMRVSADDYYRVVEPLIDEFFTRGMGRVFSARLQAEKEKAEAKHEARSAAGRKGNEKRWHSDQKTKPLKTNKTDYRNAIANGSQPEPEPEPIKDTNVSLPKKRKSRISEDAEITDAMRRAADKRNHSQQEAEAQFQKFKNDALAKGKTFVDWDRAFVTWLDSEYFRPITTKGQSYERPSKQSERLNAFIAGARGSS